MSRRRRSREYVARQLEGDSSTHYTFQRISWLCGACESRTGRPHRLGMIVRQQGRDMLSAGLERIDGPNGETKVRAVCPTCRNEGEGTAPQMRWDRLKRTLDRMQAQGTHELELRPR